MDFYFLPLRLPILLCKCVRAAARWSVYNAKYATPAIAHKNTSFHLYNRYNIVYIRGVFTSSP